jgi:hypothetical protein
MSQRPEHPKKVIPFAPAEKPAPRSDRDPMDRSGEAIVALVERAAVLSHDDCDRAMALVDHLSRELRARIHHEIKDRLIDRGAEQPRRPSAV